MTPMAGTKHMSTVAVGIMCKTPFPGQSKTRLSPPLQPHECAELSACFIRDLSRTIDTLAGRGDVTGYAVYTPVGSEDALRRLLPAGFKLMPQIEGALDARLIRATADLLDAGHRAVILAGSDSPTLPRAILSAAVDAVVAGDNVVLSPALDGGYTLVGLSTATPASVRGHPLEHGRGVSADARARPRDRPSGRRSSGMVRCRRRSIAPPARTGVRRPPAGICRGCGGPGHPEIPGLAAGMLAWAGSENLCSFRALA